MMRFLVPLLTFVIVMLAQVGEDLAAFGHVVWVSHTDDGTFWLRCVIYAGCWGLGLLIYELGRADER